MDLTAPGPSGADMMRGAPTMIRNPLGFLHQSWLRHGDVVQFPIPNPPTYLVNHPDAVDRVEGARGLLEDHRHVLAA